MKSEFIMSFSYILFIRDSVKPLVIQGRMERKRIRGRSPTHWSDFIKSITHSSLTVRSAKIGLNGDASEELLLKNRMIKPGMISTTPPKVSN